MTTPRTAIIFWLRAGPEVAALVAKRVYPITIPQSPTYPLVVVQTVSEIPGYQYRGESGLTKTRLQLDCYAQIKPGVDPVDQLDHVATAVDARLSGRCFRWGDLFVRGIFRANWIDAFEEPEINAYRAMLEIVVSHSPYVPA